MQRLALGILAFLVIALAAMNSRLRDRERILQERLASAGKRETRKPSRVIPLDPVPPPVPAPVPAPEPAAAVVTPEPARAPELKLAADTLSSAGIVMLAGRIRGIEFPFPEPDLSLTDGQRSAIEGIKANADRWIRDLLTPEQRKTYDDRKTVQFDVQLAEASYSSMTAGWKAGYLGITGGDATGGGALVSAVHDHTAASAAGLQPGDVVLDVNGAPVSNLSELTQKIRGTGEGFAATLRIRRGGVEFIQPVQLGSIPK